MKGLGRRVPTDFKHVEKYPLKAVLPRAEVKPAPMVWGINWYSDFSNPVKDRDGKYWIGKNPRNLGNIDGGHAICTPHDLLKDLKSWYLFYNQGNAPECVGFSSSRMMSLLNRKRYNPHWLYNEAQKVDEWPGEGYDGTSVRAAMDVLRTQGAVATRAGKDSPVNASEGIAANRWATTMDEVFTALGNPYYKKIGAVPLLQSWGESFPRVVWMPGETGERLLHEDGEATRITDK
jgi:hypothetical protein